MIHFQSIKLRSKEAPVINVYLSFLCDLQREERVKEKGHAHALTYVYVHTHVCTHTHSGGLELAVCTDGPTWLHAKSLQ